MTPKQPYPLISVIMPVYNREAYVGEAIESILYQTYEYFELIIVDDGSTDGTAAIINEYARRNRRIRPIYLNHGGQPNAFNAAVAIAQGDYIARQDSDDIALPQRLSTQLQWIIDNHADLCGCWDERFGFFPDHSSQNKSRWQPETHCAVVCEMLFSISVRGGNMFMKANVCKDNPFDESIDFTDTAWPQKMVLKYIMGNVPEVLVKFRMHEGNIHTVRKKEFRHHLTATRFKYFYSLFPNTPLPDYIAFARLADGDSMTSLWELERAGQWLVQFAECPDYHLKEKMRQRWETTCRRSIGLGNEVERIFAEYRQKI